MENKQLSEIQKIITLKSQYCRFIDTKQWDELKNLVVTNPEMIFLDTAGNILYTFTDSETFINSCAFLEKAITTHHVHNPEIVILSENTAKAVWAMEDLIYFPQETESPYKKLHGFGHYHETYEKIEGDWKIKAFRLERLKLDIN